MRPKFSLHLMFCHCKWQLSSDSNPNSLLKSMQATFLKKWRTWESTWKAEFWYRLDHFVQLGHLERSRPQPSKYCCEIIILSPLASMFTFVNEESLFLQYLNSYCTRMWLSPLFFLYLFLFNLFCFFFKIDASDIFENMQTDQERTLDADQFREDWDEGNWVTLNRSSRLLYF